MAKKRLLSLDSADVNAAIPRANPSPANRAPDFHDPRVERAMRETKKRYSSDPVGLQAKALKELHRRGDIGREEYDAGMRSLGRRNPSEAMKKAEAMVTTDRLLAFGAGVVTTLVAKVLYDKYIATPPQALSVSVR